MSITRMDVGERMSRIVIHNDTVYLSGQIPADVTLDIQEQTRSVLGRVDDLLKQAGTDRSKLLSATIYIRDMRDFSAMNEIWNAWVTPGQPPARACVEARMSSSGMLVEVSVIAAL